MTAQRALSKTRFWKVSAGRFAYLSAARYTIDGAVGTLFLRLGGVYRNFEEFLQLVDFVIQIKVIVVLRQIKRRFVNTHDEPDQK
jgi:hypothetical protein